MTRRQHGISLMEVLITLVVISAGLLAYVAMQRGIYREGNLSAGRVAATEIALAKLEDLRGFTRLYTTSGAFAFQDIVNNGGGTLASGTLTADNIVFTRSWTVTNYWLTTTNSAATTSTPAGSPIPSYKLVTITVSWTDHNNQAQSLIMPSIIAGIDPAFTGTAFY